MAPEWIVVGLGNPGREYARHRHNIGFWAINAVAEVCHIPFSKKGKLAHTGEGHIEGVPVILAKPRTYVNLSGKAAASILRSHKLPPSKLLVIYDDMDLPLGKVRIRQQGSPGGHNGMKSIISSLGTQDFPRLRIGIGRPGEQGEVVEYVLSTFSAGERSVVEEAIKIASDAVICIVSQGVAEAMNRYNR